MRLNAGRWLAAALLGWACGVPGAPVVSGLASSGAALRVAVVDSVGRAVAGDLT